MGSLRSALPGSACSEVHMPPPSLGALGAALPANQAPGGAAGSDPALPGAAGGLHPLPGGPGEAVGVCPRWGLPRWEESTLPLPQLAAPQGRMRPQRCQTGWAGWCLRWRGCSGTALALQGQRAPIPCAAVGRAALWFPHFQPGPPDRSPAPRGVSACPSRRRSWHPTLGAQPWARHQPGTGWHLGGNGPSHAPGGCGDPQQPLTQ